MRVWIRPEDIPKLAFVVPPHSTDTKPLIGFHLSLPMGYVESAQYFCTTIETVADIINNNWVTAATSPAHHLDHFANTSPTDSDSSPGIPSTILDAEVEALCANLPTPTAQRLRAYVDVYMDSFLLPGCARL